MLILGAAAILTAAGGAVLVSRVMDRPAWLVGAVGDQADGFRAQQKLTEILLRQAGASDRREPIEIGERELNAFLARHIALGRLGIGSVLVRPDEGQVEVAARTSLGRLGSEHGWLPAVLPAALLDLDLWIVLDGQLDVRNGKAELRVERTRLGRLRVSPDWLFGLLGTRSRDALSWRLPRVVERVELHRGRLLVHTRPR